MPYSVRKSGGKYVVVSKRTGKVKSHHATKAKAQGSVRAIYASESRKKK